MKLIQIPITFIEYYQNVSIEFEDKPENYGKNVKITLTKNCYQKPQSWEYLHILQSNNLVEFTSLDTGKYFLTVQSIDSQVIDNSFKVSITNKTVELNSIVSNNEQKVSLTINNNLESSIQINSRRGRGIRVGYLTTTGSFTTRGGRSRGGGG